VENKPETKKSNYSIDYSYIFLIQKEKILCCIAVGLVFVFPLFTKVEKNYLKSGNNNNNNKFSTIIEKYSCILFVDGINIDAKIIHKGRGKYRIVEDKYNGKYANKIVDASDVIRCKITSSNNDDDRAQIMSSSKYKLAQFSNQKQYINLETYSRLLQYLTYYRDSSTTA